jgi:hypothetical protein
LQNPKTIRRLRTLELMELALSPQTPAHTKVMSEQIILARLESTTPGERLTLAKRASQRVAEALLVGADSRVVAAALNNPRITVAAVLRSLADPEASTALVRLVCADPRWFAQPEVQVALLRHPHTPQARALQWVSELPAGALNGVVEYLSAELRFKVLEELARRAVDQGGSAWKP